MFLLFLLTPLPLSTGLIHRIYILVVYYIYTYYLVYIYNIYVYIVHHILCIYIIVYIYSIDRLKNINTFIHSIYSSHAHTNFDACYLLQQAPATTLAYFSVQPVSKNDVDRRNKS